MFYPDQPCVIQVFLLFIQHAKLEFSPLISVGSSFCCSAVWCTNSPCSPPSAADVCRELKGLEAFCPGGRWTEAEAGLPLSGHARWVFSTPQQTGPAAVTPWWGDSGPGGSYFDIGLRLCTLDHIIFCLCTFCQSHQPIIFPFKL